MRNKIDFFQKCKCSKKRNNLVNINHGFTLIELLVAMIIATLVITPLLGFMINILDTDRKEQAKVNSEQEVQTAVDYIAQDLQQAIYIYDGDGIQKIKSQLPYASNKDRVPVLVFWTRTLEKQAIDIIVDKDSVGSDDTFVYSLVAYYLIQGTTSDNTWSNQFRIARFELKDGIRNLEDRYDNNGNVKYIKEPDKGFALFKINNQTVKGTLEQKMNKWEKGNGSYNLSNVATLVDYIDASQISTSNKKELSPIDCSTVFDVDNKKAKVPSSSNTKLDNGSFYACVDVDKVSAKIFIRGNAYARLNDKNNSFDKSRESFFPTASIQINGKGLIRLLSN